jgi:hypothetical protein
MPIAVPIFGRKMPMKSAAAAAVALALYSSLASTSGSFCVPSQGAQDAIAKPPNGACPFGWTSSGSYCLRSGSARRY